MSVQHSSSFSRDRRLRSVERPCVGYRGCESGCKPATVGCTVRRAASIQGVRAAEEGRTRAAWSYGSSALSIIVETDGASISAAPSSALCCAALLLRANEVVVAGRSDRRPLGRDASRDGGEDAQAYVSRLRKALAQDSCRRADGRGSRRRRTATSFGSPSASLDAVVFQRAARRGTEALARDDPKLAVDRLRERSRSGAARRSPTSLRVVRAGRRSRGSRSSGSPRSRSESTRPRAPPGRRAHRRARVARRAASAPRAPPRAADARALSLRSPGRGAAGVPGRPSAARRRARARAGRVAPPSRAPDPRPGPRARRVVSVGARPALVPRLAWRHPVSRRVAGAVVLAVAIGLGAWRLVGDEAERRHRRRRSPSTRTPVRSRETISFGTSPSSVAVGAGSVWVLDGDDKTVTKIDPETRRVQRVFSTSSRADRHRCRRRSRVGRQRIDRVVDLSDMPRSVSRIDPASTDRRRHYLPPALVRRATSSGIGGFSRQKIAVTPDAVWVINPDQSISRIDPRRTDVVARSRRRARRSSPRARATSGSAQEGRIAEIDTARNVVSRRIPLGEDTLSGLAVGAGSVWAADPFDGALAHSPRSAGRQASYPAGSRG